MSSPGESQNKNNNIPKVMGDDEIKSRVKQIPGWNIVIVDQIPHLQKHYKFNNFVEALEFTNAIGTISEAQGHHPLIELTWGKVTVSWWTHDIGGLNENDFLMAAKTNGIFQEFKP